MILTALALVAATPATLDRVLQQARPGDTIKLAPANYRNIAIRRNYPTAITIDATDANVRGLQISGGGVLWRSGTLQATGGRYGFASLGYAALVTGRNVTFSGVTFTNARKGIVLDRASGISVQDSQFIRLGEDGIIASRVNRLAVQRNRFLQVLPKPTTCIIPGGSIINGLTKRDCDDRRGVWKDGYHADAVQMRNAVVDAVISDNVVDAKTQGFTQMDTVGDRPLERVRIERNTIAADAHHITLGRNCRSCSIRDNIVSRNRYSRNRAVIRPGAARRCQNRVQDEDADGRC